MQRNGSSASQSGTKDVNPRGGPGDSSTAVHQAGRRVNHSLVVESPLWSLPQARYPSGHASRLVPPGARGLG